MSTKPKNAYKKWAGWEDTYLVKSWDKGTAISGLARFLERSEGSITSRLVRLGLIENHKEGEMEPTLGQLQLREVLMDMKEGEVVVVRGIFTKIEYHITNCEPFVGRGKVTMNSPSGMQYVQDLPAVLACMELMDVDLTQEYMVSVDGLQAPRKVHDSYKAACDEADRLARKHLGNRVRVLKVEHVIKARQNVEVEECL